MATKRMKKPDPRTFGWKHFLGYFVPTWVLALVAVGALMVSIHSLKQTIESREEMAESNRNVADTLGLVQEGIKAYTVPFVAVVDYTWVLYKASSSKDLPEGPNNVPTGIQFTVKNLSLIPVELHDYGLGVRYGQKKFEDVTHTVGGEFKGPVILAPGQGMQVSTNQPSLFTKYLRGRQSVLEEPFLVVDYRSITSCVNDDAKYSYKTTRSIGFNPSDPFRKHMLTESEEFTQLEQDVRQK